MTASSTGPWSVQDATWIASAARTTSSVSDTKGIDRYTSLLLLVDVTVISAGTFDLYLQTLLSDGATWADIAAITQVSAAGKQLIGFVSGGNTILAVTDGTMTANTVKSVPLGRSIRVKYTIGGGGTVTFSVGVILLQ